MTSDEWTDGFKERLDAYLEHRCRPCRVSNEKMQYDIDAMWFMHHARDEQIRALIEKLEEEAERVDARWVETDETDVALECSIHVTLLRAHVVALQALLEPDTATPRDDRQSSGPSVPPEAVEGT